MQLLPSVGILLVSVLVDCNVASVAAIDEGNSNQVDFEQPPKTGLRHRTDGTSSTVGKRIGINDHSLFHHAIVAIEVGEEKQEEDGKEDQGSRFLSTTPLALVASGRTTGTGFGAYSEWQSSQEFGSGGAGLQGFAFDFVRGDEHIKEMKVQTTDRGVHLAFGDKNYDNAYTFGVRGVQLPPSSHDSHFLTRTWISPGGCWEQIDFQTELLADDLPVLTGFQVVYSNSDHHIDEVSVEVTAINVSNTRRVKVKACLNDKNDDDWFSAYVFWAVVNGSHVYKQGSTGPQFSNGGNDSFALFSLSDMQYGEVVLTGFAFDLMNNDSHLDRIMVDPTNGGNKNGVVQVSFYDDHGNKAYNWSVDGAIITRDPFHGCCH